MTPDINVLVAASRADHPHHTKALIDALLAVPGVEILEGGREWPTLRRLCMEGKLAGNAIPDAWIAAAVKINSGRLVTFDRGFTALLGKSELTLLR